MKRCTKCGKTKPRSEFNKRAASKDGLQPICRPCQRERDGDYAKKNRGRARKRAANWYAENKERAAAGAKARRERDPEKYRAQSREYQREHREQNQARARQWRAENADRKREGDRRWREANKEHKAKKDRRWAEANPERRREAQARFRENNPEAVAENRWIQDQKRRGDKPCKGTWTYVQILRGDPCSYCGAPMEHREHIIPRKGWSEVVPGWNDWTNLTASCDKCNRRKATKSVLTFLLHR